MRSFPLHDFLPILAHQAVAVGIRQHHRQFKPRNRVFLIDHASQRANLPHQAEAVKRQHERYGRVGLLQLLRNARVQLRNPLARFCAQENCYGKRDTRCTKQ